MHRERSIHMSKSAIRLLGLAVVIACVAGCARYHANVFKAAGKGELAVVKSYLQNGGDVNANNGRCTMLFCAAAGNRKTIVQLLISRGADLNAGNCKSGETPLGVSAAAGHKEIARLLISKGAKVHLADAVALGDITMLKRLIAKGADVNMPVGNNGYTVLHTTAYFNNMEAARILLSHGARVDACDSDGWTPLHSACLYGRTSIARLLVSAGADVNARDSKGDTPLSDALQMGHKETAEFLRKHGARK